jgi:hypothetical protein
MIAPSDDGFHRARLPDSTRHKAKDCRFAAWQRDNGNAGKRHDAGNSEKTSFAHLCSVVLM